MASCSKQIMLCIPISFSGLYYLHFHCQEKPKDPSTEETQPTDSQQPDPSPSPVHAMRSLTSPSPPTFGRGHSTSDLGAKLDDTPATMLDPMDEILIEEEMEEEEPTHDDEVAPTVYQDNETVQILSEDEPECVMSPSCKKTQPSPEKEISKDKQDCTECRDEGFNNEEPCEDSFYQNGGLYPCDAKGAADFHPQNDLEKKCEILPDTYEELQEALKSEDEAEKKASTKGTFKVGRGVIYDWAVCV